MRHYLLAGLLLSTSLFSRDLTYTDGIDDTLMAIKGTYEDYNPVYDSKNIITTHGYIVFAELNTLNQVDLVSYYSIGEKVGEDLFFSNIEDEQALVFGIFTRKADALYQQERLERIGLKHIRIMYLDKSLKKDVFIGSAILSSLSSVYGREIRHMEDSYRQEITALKGAFETSVTDGKGGDIALRVIPRHDGVEKKCRPTVINTPCDCPSPEIKRYVKVSKGTTFQVVNRIVTKEFLDRFYPEKGAESVRPVIRKKFKSTKGFDEERADVAKRAFKDSDDLETQLEGVKNIKTAFNVITKSGVISDKDELVISKRIFKRGDRIGSFTLFDISHKNGVIVLKDSKTKSVYQGKM